MKRSAAPIRLVFSTLLCTIGSSLAACHAPTACGGCETTTTDAATSEPRADLAPGSDGGSNPDGSSAGGDLAMALGEDCVSAQPLQFVGNRAVINDTTLGRRNDTSASCGGLGADTVYSLSVFEPYLGVQVIPTGDWMPHVYLKSTCEKPQTVADICATSAFFTSRFPVGRYFLVVDADGAGGDYQLTVEQRASNLGRGESCSAPRLLSFTGDTATVTTAMNGSSSGPRLRCTSSPGRDIYSLVLGSPQRFEAVATTTTAGVRPVLALRGAGTLCSSGGDVACVSAISNTATLNTTTPLPAGSYSLIVTDAGGGGGQYTLTVKVSP